MFIVMFVNQMLSVSVTVRPTGWRNTAPTT